MENEKIYMIEDIESLTRKEAEKMAEKKISVKGYDVFFIDFGGYFGYSMIVYWNDRLIKYANDYELHHEYIVKKTGIEGLKVHYIKTINNTLFTEDELGVVENYDDYLRKGRYLSNLYPLRSEYETIFCINPTKEEQEAFKKKTKGWTYDPKAFAYFPDKAFVEQHLQLCKKLDMAEAKLKNDYKYLKEAYIQEMFNHEYSINMQADWDVLSAFCDGELPWYEEDLNKYFEYLNFSPTQIKAYRDAREEYYNQIETM